MPRLLLSLLALVLLAAAGLLALYLLGQLLVFLGIFLRGSAGVLARLLWFLLLATLTGGLAYFLGSVYRKP